MRAKLERIAAGKIEYVRPQASVSPSLITLSVKPGERESGYFTFSAEQPVKGVAYASTDRMSLEHASFKGRAARMNYCFDARGLAGDEEIEGSFCIITEAGEFSLPYTVHVEPQHRTPEEESYAYFVSADPIAPLPQQQEAKGETVVTVTGGAVSERPLEEICAERIRDGRTDADSFPWYLHGVEQELKITNLFEYFMMALPENYRKPLPEPVLRYFARDDQNLSSQAKAGLYAAVIRFQPPESELYRAYRERMEAFMLEQLLERRQSEDMAVVYQRFLVEDLLTIDFAEALADIMFLRRLRCPDPRIRQVQVLYEQLQRRISVPLVGGQALIPIYTPGAVILLVDEQGNCYTSSVPYTLTRLLDERRYAGRCRELLRYHQGLYLYLCDGASRSHVLTKENVENYKRILKISGLTVHYKEDVRREILQFYYANHELEELDREFFLTETARMSPKDRARYTEILILRGLYEEAYEMVRRHGYSLVRVKLLVRLAAWRIREAEYGEDEFLLKLCYYLFQNHIYNEGILEYLAGYYYGPAQAMEELWREAREFELNVFDLEERLLGQMLFTGDLRPAAFEIFCDYHALGGEGVVSRAYLTWLAWQDFVKDQPIPEEAYGYLEKGIAWEENLPPVCGLAYLRYLSGRAALSEPQRIRAEQMAKAYIRRRMRFGFLKPLLERLGQPWLLEDRTFVEYRSDPAHKVVIHYVKESPKEPNVNYVAERLYPVEPGIFVREFTLFYGERLTWFITEEGEDGTEISTPDASYAEECEDALLTGSKYADIYEMARALSDRDLQEFADRAAAYEKKKFLVETTFSLK